MQLKSLFAYMGRKKFYKRCKFLNLPWRLRTCAPRHCLVKRTNAGIFSPHHGWTGSLNWYNISNLLFFPSEGYRCGLYHVHVKKLASWLCLLTNPSWRFLVPIRPEPPKMSTDGTKWDYWRHDLQNINFFVEKNNEVL